MTSNFIFFVKTPDLNNLVTLILDVTAANGISDASFYHRRIFKCRELIFSTPQVLATPELSRKHNVLAIVPKCIFESAEFRFRITKIGFKVISVVDVTDDVLQECFHYTAIAKMAPNWNLVGDMLIQGRDFLMAVEPMNAVKLEVIVAKDEMHLNIHAFAIRMPNLKLEYYEHSFHFQEWQAEGDITKPLIIPLSEDCHVLPSLKQATLLSITNHIPKDSCFKHYKEFKKHWKNMYGYRLPDMPSEEIWYCNVAFHVFRRTIYSYPMLCIRPSEPSIVPRVDPQKILCDFLNDFHRKISTVCGQSCQLMEMRPAFPDVQLYPAIELKEDMKPRCGTTYSAPNKKIPYRKNAEQTAVASCSKPYYTPKPLNLANLCTPHCSRPVNVSHSKQKLLPLTSKTLQSLTNFNNPPTKSYKPFENLSQKSQSSEALRNSKNTFSNSVLATTQPFNELSSNDFEHEKLSYHPKQQNIGLYADDNLQCNSSIQPPFHSTRPMQSKKISDSTNLQAQNLNHPKSKDIETLKRSPFYPLQSFVQMSQVSPQIHQESSGESLVIRSAGNLSPENKFFSPLANETSPDETENAEVYKFIMSNKMAGQMIPNSWLDVSSCDVPENIITLSEGPPVPKKCTYLATSSPLGNPNRLIHQEPFSSIENFPNRRSSSYTEMSGAPFAKSSSMRPMNQVFSTRENQNSASGHGMSQVLTPAQIPNYSDMKESNERYTVNGDDGQNSTKVTSKQHLTKGQNHASKSPWFSNTSEEQRLSLSMMKPKRIKSSKKVCKSSPSGIRCSYSSQKESESSMKSNFIVRDKTFIPNDKFENSLMPNQLISTPPPNNTITSSKKTVKNSDFSEAKLVSNTSLNNISNLSLDDKENPNAITPLGQAECFQKLDHSLRKEDDTTAKKQMYLEHSTTMSNNNDQTVHMEQHFPISTPNHPTKSNKKEKSKNTSMNLKTQKHKLNKSSISLDAEEGSSINKGDELKGKGKGKKSIDRKISSSKVSKVSTKPKKLLPVQNQHLMDTYIKKSASENSTVLKNHSPAQEMPQLSEMREIYAQQGTPSLYERNEEKMSLSNGVENMEHGKNVLGKVLISPFPEKKDTNSTHYPGPIGNLALASNRHIMAAKIAEQSFSSQPAKVIPQFFKKFGKAQNNFKTSTPIAQTDKRIPTFFPKKKASTQPISDNVKAPFPDALLAVKVTRGISKTSKVKSAGKRKKLYDI